VEWGQWAEKQEIKSVYDHNCFSEADLQKFKGHE